MRAYLSILVMLIPLLTLAQRRETENIVIVTLDGFRWKEVFGGPDPRILFDPNYVEDTLVWQRFGDPSESVSRSKLMPFLWNVIGTRGQLYGNRKLDSKVNSKNPDHQSYPGYNELLAGFYDPMIRSNHPEFTPNETVLEFIDRQSVYQGQVAVFAASRALHYVLNQPRTGLLVGRTPQDSSGDAIVDMPSDADTFDRAFAYLKKERPRVLLISFHETDTYADDKQYDAYLEAANRVDRYVASMWEWIQQDSAYRDHTTLVITTNHGRGAGKNSWMSHRRFSAAAGHLWFAVIGPDTPAFGEMAVPAQYYQDQLARTIAAFLGLNFNPPSTPGPIVQTMLSVPPDSEGNVLVDKQ